MDEGKQSGCSGTLAEWILSCFELSHRHYNLHVVRLVLMLVTHTQVKKRMLYEVDIVERVNTLLSDAVNKCMDDFYEYLLGIVYDLLCFTASRLQVASMGPDGSSEEAKQIQIQLLSLNEPLVSNVDTLISILGCETEESSPDTAVRNVPAMKKAAECLLLITRLYPHFSDLLFTPHNLRLLSIALTWSLDQVENDLRPMQRCVLQCVLLICRRDAKYIHLLNSAYNSELIDSITRFAYSSADEHANDDTHTPAERPSSAVIARSTVHQLAQQLQQLIQASI
jgi:hypothetical protein